MDLPIDDPKKWGPLARAYLAESHALTEALYSSTASEERKKWPSSPEGLTLCASLKELWLATIARWESLAQEDDPQTAPDNILSAASITQKILDHMCLDYRYRTNEAPPSGPLWDYLEKDLDMPAQCERLLDLFDACDNKWASTYGSVCATLHETLALTALARTHLPYPLRDTGRHEFFWEHMEEFRNFWYGGNFLDPQGPRHESLVKGMHALPSTKAGFYEYVVKDPLMEKTARYAFEHFAPEPESSGATMRPWFSWLATLQSNESLWKDAKERWPRVTELLTLVSTLESPENVGRAVWELYVQLPEKAPVSAPLDNVDALFEQ